METVLESETSLRLGLYHLNWFKQYLDSLCNIDFKLLFKPIPFRNWLYHC